MRGIVVLVGALLVACSSPDRPATTHVVDSGPAPYDVTIRMPPPPSILGAGTFNVHAKCTTPSDTIASGTCVYQDVVPVNTSQGLDADGWSCAGTALDYEPFGWVLITLHCVP